MLAPAGPAAVTDSADEAMSKKEDHDADGASLFRDAMAGIQRDRRAYRNKRHLPHENRPKPPARAAGEILPAAQPVALDQTGGAGSLQFYRGGVRKTEFRSLRNGETRPRAELDLHGYTSRQAWNLLDEFIACNVQHGVAVVRVIHGKGLHSADHGAVLKSQTVHQLKADHRVRAFTSAPPADGGSGAVHVLLQSARHIQA